MTETPWGRLRRLIDLRRQRLGLTLAGLNAVGGPSPKWVHKLTMMEGLPSNRMRASLLDLDRSLAWEDGTSWGLLTVDRSGWSDVMLADEEVSLIERADEAEQFAFVVAARVRAIPEGRERDEAMRAVLAVLGVEA